MGVATEVEDHVTRQVEHDDTGPIRLVEPREPFGGIRTARRSTVAVPARAWSLLCRGSCMPTLANTSSRSAEQSMPPSVPPRP
jgi:hypothetical protein